MKSALAAIIVCLSIAGYFLYPVFTSPSQIVNDALLKQQMEVSIKSPPIQTPTTRIPFAYHDFTITPRAEYDITARVFSTRHYYWNFIDHFYSISPEDLALGWGPLSDYRNKELLHIRQEGRFFMYRWKGAPPYPRQTMVENMANTHIVPASREAERQLSHIHSGDIVHLTGALIDITDSDRGTIYTSLTRSDSGPGACEILWLETVEIDR